MVIFKIIIISMVIFTIIIIMVTFMIIFIMVFFKIVIIILSSLYEKNNLQRFPACNLFNSLTSSNLQLRCAESCKEDIFYLKQCQDSRKACTNLLLTKDVFVEKKFSEGSYDHTLLLYVQPRNLWRSCRDNLFSSKDHQ